MRGPRTRHNPMPLSASAPAASGQRQGSCIGPRVPRIAHRRLPPTLDFRQLVFGPFGDDLAPPQVDLSTITVDRNPFTLRHRGARELRPPARDVDRGSIAAHDAWFSHLSGDKGGMRVRPPTAVTMPTRQTP